MVTLFLKFILSFLSSLSLSFLISGDVLKDEKLIKEFMKHEAKELEKEIDSAAFMAESMVSGTNIFNFHYY